MVMPETLIHATMETVMVVETFAVRIIAAGEAGRDG